MSARITYVELLEILSVNMASKKHILISPSILSSNLGKLEEEVRSVESAGADWIHIDVMDGHFVPNITFGTPIIKAVRQATSLPIDVHLMISPVDSYISDFVEAGSSILTVHPEAGPHLHRTIQAIKNCGVKAGVALNPATPIELVLEVIHMLDLVLVMSVNPGFGGQKFIIETLHKVTSLKEHINNHKLDTLVEIDGGINTETAKLAIAAGADVLVSGTALFGQKDYYKAISNLRS